jgi:hypothetical protein
MSVIEAPYSSSYGSNQGYSDVDSNDLDSLSHNSIIAVHFHRNLFETLRKLNTMKATILQIVLFDYHPVDFNTVHGIHCGEYGVIVADLEA